MYSSTDRDSFNKVENLLDRCRRIREDTNIANIPVMILANKCDLVELQQVQSTEGRDLARRLGASFYRTSARTGKNINESFFQMIRLIKANRKRGNPRHNQSFEHRIARSAKVPKRSTPKSTCQVM